MRPSRASRRPATMRPGGGHAHVGAHGLSGRQLAGRIPQRAFHPATCTATALTHDLFETDWFRLCRPSRQQIFCWPTIHGFRGLTLQYGPDGGVFISDWTDTGECHNHVLVDQTNGRIFKVVFGTPAPWHGDLAKLTDSELVNLQLQSQ